MTYIQDLGAPGAGVTGVDGAAAEFLLDAEELVILGDAVGEIGRASCRERV